MTGQYVQLFLREYVDRILDDPVFGWSMTDREEIGVWASKNILREKSDRQGTIEYL